MKMSRFFGFTDGPRLNRLPLAALLGAFLVAGTASAVEFSVVGPDNFTIGYNETITFGIVMTNTSNTSVYGIGASVHGYDPNEVEFLGGSAVANYLNQICVAPGTCFGGLTNLAAPNLVESSIGDNGPRVQFALSAALTPAMGAPGVDQGLDGQISSVMFSFTFLVRRPCTSFQIDTLYPGDGVIVEGGEVIQAQGAFIDTAICPEPGTALLMGLGLAGLSASPKRRRREPNPIGF